MKHLNINKYSYESKSLKIKLRIDYFLIAKHLSQYVRKADIQTSAAPDPDQYSGKSYQYVDRAFGNLTTVYLMIKIAYG